MKRLLLPIVFSGFIILSNAQSNCIKVDVLGVLTKRIGLSYERAFSKHFSGQLTFEKATYAKGESNQQNVYSLTGMGLIPEVRYYPFAKKRSAPRGFFVGSAFRYIKLKEEYMPNDVYLKGDLYNFGIDTGYKFNSDLLVVELLLGSGTGSVKNIDREKRKQIDPFYASSLSDVEKFFRVEVSIGILFPHIKKE